MSYLYQYSWSLVVGGSLLFVVSTTVISTTPSQGVGQQEDDKEKMRRLLEEKIKDDTSSDAFIELERLRNQLPAVELIQLIEDGHAIRRAKMTKEQVNRVSALHAKCLKQLKELLGEENVSTRLEWAKYKYLDWSKLPKLARVEYEEIKKSCKLELLNIIQTKQLKAFDNMGLINGLPRMTTESALSEILDLTDEQKTKIQVESNRLAKEIEDFVHDARQRSAKISLKHLTEKQRNKLYEVYGKPQIQRQLAMTPLRYIFRYHLFTENPPEGSMSLPQGKHVDWTDLDWDKLIEAK